MIQATLAHLEGIFPLFRPRHGNFCPFSGIFPSIAPRTRQLWPTRGTFPFDLSLPLVSASIKGIFPFARRPLPRTCCLTPCRSNPCGCAAREGSALCQGALARAARAEPSRQAARTGALLRCSYPAPRVAGFPPPDGRAD